MDIKLRDRWDDMFGDIQHLELDINENEYVSLESKVDESGIRWTYTLPGRHQAWDVFDSNTNEDVRSLTAEEYDAVFEFAEEQFEVEEEFK